MQKWEYCRVSYGPVVRHVIFMKPDNMEYQKLPHEQRDGAEEGISSLYRFIARLGEEGWELVGTAIDGGDEGEVAWLKRPLP